MEKCCLQPPSKILDYARTVVSNLHKIVQMPIKNSKKQQLKSLVQLRNAQIQSKIEAQIKQNRRFRKLQNTDVRRRRSMLQKIDGKLVRINNLKLQRLKERSQLMHRMNTQVERKYQKHKQNEQIYNQDCEKEANRLDKQVIEHFAQQQQKQIQQWNRLQNIKCHLGPAMQLIGKREKKSYQFSLNTSKQLQNKLIKNQKKQNPEFQLTKKENLQHLQFAYNKSMQYYDGKHKYFLKKYCQDIQTANIMLQTKKKNYTETSQKIHQFIIKKGQKASRNKRYLDQQNEVIPIKCLERIQKAQRSPTSFTTQASSTFFDASKTWISRNKMKKIQIQQNKMIKDTEVISKHIDLSRVNRGSNTINKIMLDLKMKAKFNAKQFL